MIIKFILNSVWSLVASSSLDAMIRIWDIESGKQIKTIDASPGKQINLKSS